MLGTLLYAASVSFVVAALPPPPPLPSNYTGVVLLTEDVAGTDPEVFAEITRNLADQIDEIPGHQVISTSDALSAVANYNLTVDTCDREVACLAQLARYARGHMLLEVRIQAPAGTVVISVRAIDAQKGRELNRVALALEQDEQLRLQQLQQLVVQLVAPDAYVGRLAVDCPDDGAEVYVDDQLLGYIPLKTQPELPAGVHIMRISKAGFEDINRFVDVAYNRLTTIKADLNDRTVNGRLVENQSTTGFGGLYIYSEVSGLEVRVDGEPLGVTPLSVAYDRIAAGHHRVSLRKSNTQPVAQEIDVFINQRTDLALRITSQGMRLELLDVVPKVAPLPTAESVAAKTAAATSSAGLASTIVAPNDYLTWRTYTAVGCGAAGIASFVAAYLIQRDIDSDQKQANALQQQSQVNGVDTNTLASLAAQIQQLNSDGAHLNTWQNVTAYGGAALILSGAALATWDLVRSAGPATAPEPVTFIPRVQPTQIDAVVKFAW